MLHAFCKLFGWKWQRENASAPFPFFCTNVNITFPTISQVYVLRCGYVLLDFYHIIQAWWRHQMETFSALLAQCEWNPPVNGDSPHKVQWLGALMDFFCLCLYKRLKKESRRGRFEMQLHSLWHHSGDYFEALMHVFIPQSTLRWRRNDHAGVSNHQPHGCLLNRLFRRKSKKTSKLRVTGLCAGNSPVNFPHKWPVTRKMFPFDDVIMRWDNTGEYGNIHHINSPCDMI